MLRAMRGFTQTEASNTIYMCGTEYKGFPIDVVKMIHRQKAATFRNDDILEYVDEDTITDSSQIGGYEVYMEYVDECIECYSPEAMKMGIKRPKGVLLLGIPGTGKSMVAMATAKKMGLPLIKYDFSAVFAGVVGESEARQRRALRRIIAQGPCVLLLDEADKAFGGIVGSNNDGGVGQRVFGRLLSWMANENQEAFVVMTMNRLVDPNTGAVIVPIETIRSGRLDAIWYTDFPNKVEREEILAIHMAKNGADWLALHEEDRAELLKNTDKYVGAELEQLCIKAVRTAWKERKVVQPTYAEVAQARKLVSPVAVMDEINIKKINDFCRDRAIPVSRVKAAPKPVGPARRSVDFKPGDN
jgi:SpoVK/Ycf46/Vps4 family AAA+-type ATPase